MSLPSSDSFQPSRGDLLDQMQESLHRVMRWLVFRGDPNSPLNEFPVSQLRCLFIVAHEEGLKMQDISHRMELRLPAVSQIVDRLVKRNMLVRQTDPDDRRVVRLKLSDTAHHLLARAHEERNARMVATAANLNESEMKQVIHGLQLLAGAAEKAALDEKEAMQSLSSDPEPLLEIMARRKRARRENR